MYKLKTHIYICTYTDAWLQKKREHIGNFGTVDPKKYQDYTKIVKIYIYICIYHNIYGPTWGGILSFP